MKPINPLSVDFAALRTLRLVHDNLSFSAAAEVLEVNQSAVSYTIDRLRRVFDDPLFVRQGAQVVATDRCSDLVERAIEILNDFEAMTAASEFDPAVAEHRFSIACNYYERRIILPWVVPKLRRLAPKVTLDIINSTARGRMQLLRSDTEMLIGPIRPEENGFYCRNLINEHYVVIMDPGHPLAKGGFSFEAYAAAPQALVTYGGNFRSQFLEEIEEKGLDINVVMTTPSPASLEQMVMGTDIIATVPSRVGATFTNGVKVVEGPFEKGVDIDLVWTTRTHRSPKHMWLRDLIAEQVAKGAA